MKGKKHASHPKSYPVPAQLPTAISRNQYATNVIKGGTLQVPPKTHVTRSAKSPTTNSKKPFDLPINPNPKLMALAKQPFSKNPIPGPRVIKPEPNKSLKKSLSNNDIQIPASSKPEALLNRPMGKPPLSKRHSPSPTQQLKSPSPPRTAGSNKVPIKNSRLAPKGKISEFQPTPITKSPPMPSRSPAPWNEYLYYLLNKRFRSKKKDLEAKLRDFAEEGNVEECKKILNTKQGPMPILDVNAKNDEGWTALHLATNEGHFAVVRALLEAKADTESRTKQLKTALHIACCRGDLKVVRLLVEHKADLSAQDIEGNTCLHIIAMYGMNRILEWLSTHSNLSLVKYIKNSYQKLPSDVAANSEILSLLGVKKSEPFNIRQTKQVHVYHTNQICVNKYMGILSKPAGDSSEEDPGSLASSYADIADDDKKVNIVRGPVNAKHMKGKDRGEEPSKTADKEEKVGPHSFIVHQVLGKGSFGEVYLVEKLSTHKLYAMKVLSKGQIMSQNLVKYALTERDVLSITNHPFIVRLNYAFQTNRKLFLILNYCPGGDLSEYIEREKRFTEDRARIYLSEILLALQDLHKRDIIYRDLKPDNVVLDEEGHALLTDFGLSKQGIMDNVGAKSFCGSVAYLAPEMIKRSGHGKAVDWYLFGVLMYEMLVGQPPYFHKDKEQLFQNIQRGVLKIPARMSEEAKSLIVALLNRNPNKRLGAGPRDAEEIKEQPFFKGVCWKDVYARKLTPPKPTIKKDSFVIRMSPQMLQSSTASVAPENNIPGWSFSGHTKKA